jgi:hypothetical protein
MAKDRQSATTSEAEHASGAALTASAAAQATQPADARVASHDALFASREDARCDACGATLPESDEDGYSVPGRGVYLWIRGDEVRLEDVPLCASCASAIGMTALARWEIEEEEG